MTTVSDLGRLKLAIATLLTSAVVVAIVHWHLGGELRDARAAQQQADRDYREAHRMYVDARQDQGLMRETIARFHALEQRGMVGEEARLDWVEHLNRARQMARLERLDFELRPRRQIDGRGAGGLSVTASTMRLRSELAHAGRLLDFLDELATEPTALTRVRRCEVGYPLATGSRGKLEFECELDWVTIARRAQEESR